MIILSCGAISAGILLLNASQNKPSQAINTDVGTLVGLIGSLAITDKQYIVPVSNQPLPIIQAVTDPLESGDRLSGQGIEFTTELLRELSKNQVAVESVTLYTRDYSILLLSTNTNVIYKEKGSASELATSLQSMLSVFTIEGRMPTEIDFRFDKPVLRY